MFKTAVQLYSDKVFAVKFDEEYRGFGLFQYCSSQDKAFTRVETIFNNPVSDSEEDDEEGEDEEEDQDEEN